MKRHFWPVVISTLTTTSSLLAQEPYYPPIPEYLPEPAYDAPRNSREFHFNPTNTFNRMRNPFSSMFGSSNRGYNNDYPQDGYPVPPINPYGYGVQPWPYTQAPQGGEPDTPAPRYNSYPDAATQQPAYEGYTSPYAQQPGYDDEANPYAEQPLYDGYTDPYGRQPVYDGYPDPAAQQPLYDGYADPYGQQPVYDGYPDPAAQQPLYDGYANPYGQQPVYDGYPDPAALQPLYDGYANPYGRQPVYDGYPDPAAQQPLYDGYANPYAQQPTYDGYPDPAAQQPGYDDNLAQPPGVGGYRSADPYRPMDGSDVPVPQNPPHDGMPTDPDYGQGYRFRAQAPLSYPPRIEPEPPAPLTYPEQTTEAIAPATGKMESPLSGDQALKFRPLDKPGYSTDLGN